MKVYSFTRLRLFYGISFIEPIFKRPPFNILNVGKTRQNIVKIVVQSLESIKSKSLSKNFQVNYFYNIYTSTIIIFSSYRNNYNTTDELSSKITIIQLILSHAKNRVLAVNMNLIVIYFNSVVAFAGR